MTICKVLFMNFIFFACLTNRHSWCTKSDGALLKFYVKVAQEYMSETSAYRSDLEQAYEQCIYCLYGHPNKKGRARHLQDHNATQIEIDWTTAVELFEYYKPNSMPEFDSYKQDAVSGDVSLKLFSPGTDISKKIFKPLIIKERTVSIFISP